MSRRSPAPWPVPGPTPAGPTAPVPGTPGAKTGTGKRSASRWAPVLGALGAHVVLFLLAGGLTVFTLPGVRRMMFKAPPPAPATAPPAEIFEMQTEAFEEAVGETALPDVLSSTGLSDLPLPDLPETELFDVTAYRDSPQRADLAGAALSSAPLDIGADAAVGLAESSATSFFGIQDRTESVVVIWDVTRSMMNVNGREGYERVRSEVASLVRELNPDTRFSVVVFAGGIEVYSDDLVYASKKERDNALAWITGKNTASARPTDGTRGANRSDLAIETALAMGADVVYFITDGEPFYSTNKPIPPDEIFRMTDRLQRRRRFPARIHVIGFGTDTNDATRRFLEGLARRNNGVFRELAGGRG